MKKELLTVRETAKILGCTEESVRCWIKDGSCPFGKQVVKNNNKKGKYLVFRYQLETFLGHSLEV